MASAPPAPPPSATDDAPLTGRNPLKVSRYERTATLVIALLVVVGTLFLGLAIIFFSNKLGGPAVEPIAFVPMEGGGSPTANGGTGTDPEPPGVEDAPDLSEPALQDTLTAVASTTALVSDMMVTDTAAQSTAERAGKGKGLGDGRQPGPGGEGVVERVPRWNRWKIRFEPKSAADFAEWLDQFGIRVGVLGRDNKVHVAWGFSKGKPSVEAADPKTYANWGQTLPTDGPMPALTKDLARQANILQLGRIALLFYPFDVEKVLYTLESAQNKYKDPNKIRETVFTVLHERNGFRFVVVEQKYF
jgi:hypothetical protein